MFLSNVLVLIFWLMGKFFSYFLVWNLELQLWSGFCLKISFKNLECQNRTVKKNSYLNFKYKVPPPPPPPSPSYDFFDQKTGGGGGGVLYTGNWGSDVFCF